MSEGRVLRAGVFLDRDGTIAEEVGYLNDIGRFRIFEYSAQAIQRLNRAEFPVIVVTNQSGAARGFFPESLIHQVHERMKKELAAGGAHVDAIYYCPHHRDDNCDCRKPLPGMLERAVREHGISLRDSYLVGDRYDDAQMIQAAGGKGILVLTGYGRGEYQWNREKWPRQPDYVAENLSAAVDYILEEGNRRPAEMPAAPGKVRR